MFSAGSTHAARRGKARIFFSLIASLWRQGTNKFRYILNLLILPEYMDRDTQSAFLFVISGCIDIKNANIFDSCRAPGATTAHTDGWRL